MADPRTVADTYYGALERLDAAGAASTLLPDARIEVPGATFEGPDGFQAWMQAFFDAFPDIQHDHSDYKIEGDALATELRVWGTHTAPLVSPEGAIPATGRSMEIFATNRMTFSGDRIAAITISFDQEGFMHQLGIG